MCFNLHGGRGPVAVGNVVILFVELPEIGLPEIGEV
jgi:hypothetical protein